MELEFLPTWIYRDTQLQLGGKYLHTGLCTIWIKAYADLAKVMLISPLTLKALKYV